MIGVFQHLYVRHRHARIRACARYVNIYKSLLIFINLYLNFLLSYFVIKLLNYLYLDTI